MTPVKTLKVLGDRACGMKNTLELKKEELIVDLTKHLCANICLVALNNFV